jgi:lambda family phage portal protein
MKLNWYDRAIGFFSPYTMLKRQKAKMVSDFISRKYEGADGGRRTSGWHTGSGSANAEIATGKIRLRNRVRDLIRNNPYAARGAQTITNNVVGRGIVTQIKVDTRATQSNREKRLNEIWRAWANTKACDYEGRATLFDMQRTVMRAVVESGDVLVRRRRTGRRTVRDSKGKNIELPPIQLQILEGDFIATNQVNRHLTNGNSIIEGIEVDPAGKVVAYHVYKAHPGNINVNISNSFETMAIPADEVLFLYRADRPGQLSGMPWLAPVVLRLRDFDLYEDAQLKRQQCAAMFTAFIRDIDGLDELAETEQEAEIGEKMEPGLMEILPPGKDITLSNPPGADNYKEYTTVVLKSIAAGLGITYESLTGDLSDVNFSSARMGWLEMQRNVETWRKSIMISQFMEPVFDWFIDALELIGENASSATAVFTPPKREMIDPTKEIPALKTAVRNGFKTLSEAARELGKDPDIHFAEYASDMKTLDELGIVLDSDVRKRDNSGKVNSEELEESDSDEENE